MKLIWKYGHEAICPSCGHQNACLYDGLINGDATYRCRDCKKLFRKTGPEVTVGKDDILGRPIVEAPCILTTCEKR